MIKTTLARRVPLGRASLVTKGSIGPHMETQGLWTKTELSDR
ncbi:hypothetical protein [Sphingomonas sabuli]|nr:hypothetical protein [Sphingomonas sabuli]